MTAFFAPEYTYIAVLGVICGFIFAFGIGANDVANAFGSSVSARSLTLSQAIICGSVMEISGALLLGAKVTGTIRGKIIKPEYYEDDPEVFMFGSLSALMVGMIWLLLATYWGFPVSTTHDIVAAYLGFSIAANGFESVDWDTTKLIFISWVAAPLFAGTISFIFFSLVKKFVHGNTTNTFERALHVYPIVVFIAFTANIFFIMYKSGKNKTKLDEWEWGHYVVLPSSLGGGTLAGIITWLFLLPWLRVKINRQYAEQETQHGITDHDLIESDDTPPVNGSVDIDNEDKAFSEYSEYDVDDEPMPTRHASTKSVAKVNFAEKVVMSEAPVEEAPQSTYDDPNCLKNFWNYFADNTFRQDLHEQSMQESVRAKHIWDTTTRYDPKTESLFEYLQVFTACLASFSHGSNDVANAIAPVSGILQIYQDGEFNTKAPVNYGILFMGGAGIALGFIFFGYRIVKSVGFKLTHLSPSKGFCVELGAALAVSLASFLRIPVSTTQCLVGATCGVGLAAGGRKAVEWWYLLRTMCGWVGIFFVVAVVNAGFFSFVVFSPKL